MWCEAFYPKFEFHLCCMDDFTSEYSLKSSWWNLFTFFADFLKICLPFIWKHAFFKRCTLLWWTETNRWIRHRRKKSLYHSYTLSSPLNTIWLSNLVPGIDVCRSAWWWISKHRHLADLDLRCWICCVRLGQGNTLEHFEHLYACISKSGYFSSLNMAKNCLLKQEEDIRNLNDPQETSFFCQLSANKCRDIQIKFLRCSI